MYFKKVKQIESNSSMNHILVPPLGYVLGAGFILTGLLIFILGFTVWLVLTICGIIILLLIVWWDKRCFPLITHMDKKKSK
jgi:hypothetical protein